MTATTPPPTATPTAPGSTTPEADAVGAAQAALAGEHACIYGYGVVGAHLPGDAAPTRQALAAHRSNRDTLSGLIRAAGAEPVAAASGYTLPEPVTDTATAARLAAQLESRLGASYADLVAAADTAALRELAVNALVSAATQVAIWSGSTSAFPGLDGRLDGDSAPSATPSPSPESTS